MKYPHPLTANQEIGWIASAVVSAEQKFNKSFQSHTLTSCQETLFGSAYFAMKGHGQFSNKGKGGGLLPKIQQTGSKKK